MQRKESGGEQEEVILDLAGYEGGLLSSQSY